MFAYGLNEKADFKMHTIIGDCNKNKVTLYTHTHTHTYTRYNSCDSPYSIVQGTHMYIIGQSATNHTTT